MNVEIPPRSGTSFLLSQGDRLRVIDPEGEQVADLVAFNAGDTRESISSGRSLDYASKLWLTTGDLIYSNRSNPIFTLNEDTVGRHDFLLTPCSKDTFRIIYGQSQRRVGCFENLSEALAPFNIAPDQIPTAFNIFMHVSIDAETGQISVEPPKSRPGDFIEFEAQMDLIIGLTACSAEQSNNFSFKPIQYEILTR